MRNNRYISIEYARRRIGGVIAAAALALSLMLLVILPLQRERQRLGDELKLLQTRLQPYLSRSTRDSMAEQAKHKQIALQKMEAEWEYLRLRMETFPRNTRLADVLDSPEEGRIDYKIALYDARNHLADAAREAGVSLPDDSLGLPETIGADESAEVLLWQLAVTKLLINRGIETGLPVIRKVRAYRPLSQNLAGQNALFVYLYPVFIESRQNYAQLTVFLDALLKNSEGFILQRFEARVSEIDADPLLDVTIICSAALFRSGIPEEPVVEDTPATPEETELLLPGMNVSRGDRIR